MSIFVCSLNSLWKKLKEGERMAPEAKKKVYAEMDRISKEFTSDPKYRNIQQSKRNNFDHFEWLWEKYTGKVVDPSIMPANLKDIRKFEAGLRQFNEVIGTKQGLIGAALKLPKAQLRTLPELKQFEESLTSETSFFRDYNIDTSKKINSFLGSFQGLAKSLGSDVKTLQKLEKALDMELKRRTTLKGSELAESNQRINEIQKGFRTFYESGSGDAFLLMNHALQGAPIGKDMGIDRVVEPSEQALLRDMVSSFNGVRKRSVPMLIRGLERVKILAKERNLPWVDAEIDRINSQIRQIEFQDMITDRGSVVDPSAFKADATLLKLGFAGSTQMDANGKVALKHYMPKYTLGIMSQISTLEKDVINRNIEPSKRLRQELDKTDALINRVKGRSELLDDRYSVDPYFFLKKYAGDVALFNYRSHVKDTFRRAYNALVKDHLDPAKEAGNQDVIDATESMLKNLTGIYESVHSIDPKSDTVGNDLIRAMQSLTYFRLLGGNVRSAARNATQRLYEFVEFGMTAHKNGREFYSNHANADANVEMRDRQSKKYGLQWFDGKTVRSKLLDGLTGEEADISSASRGALQENFYNQKGLAVNENGEIVMSSDRMTQKVARAAGEIAQRSAFMHKLVEDANRSGTFGIAFSLAHQNLSTMPENWIYNQMMKGKRPKAYLSDGEFGYTSHGSSEMKWVRENQKQVKDWIENTAGRMAYNSAVDLHFEYADWNKAKALKSKKGKFFGQFMHYRFSMFDLMHKWVSEGLRSVKARDFSSEEVWKMLRFGILNATLSVASSATHTNFMKLFNNDVIETGEAGYLWATTDRDDPEQVAKLEKKTYGQGGWYFAGANANYVLSMFEQQDFFYKDEDDARKHEENLAHLEDDDRTKLYKLLALGNAQMARTAAYTWPVFIKQGFIPAAQLELGQFESKEQRATRNLAFEKFEEIAPGISEFLGIQPKATGRTRPKRRPSRRKVSEALASQDALMQSLDLLQS